mmetsp:Transcript_58812/g.191842  ORF Transcript_58812/g.191842 Transcript_58812/m.191842 type:complete len:214 (+) Transcript_58812:471-1112(+)
MHLCGIIPARNVLDGDTASALRQKPLEELLATPALLPVARDEGDMANIRQNRTCCPLQLLPGGALLAQGIAQLIILQDDPVGVEAPLAAGLLTHTLGEEARVLGLHTAHDLKLGSTPSTRGSEDDKFLAAALTLPPAFVLGFIHEEHQHAPLFLHHSQRRTTSPGDVADAIAGHIHHSAIVAILPTIDIDRTLELLEQPFHVLASFLPLRTRA